MGQRCLRRGHTGTEGGEGGGGGPPSDCAAGKILKWYCPLSIIFCVEIFSFRSQWLYNCTRVYTVTSFLKTSNIDVNPPQTQPSMQEYVVPQNLSRWSSDRCVSKVSSGAKTLEGSPSAGTAAFVWMMAATYTEYGE